MDDEIAISGIGELLFADSSDYDTMHHATVSLDTDGGAATFTAHIVRAPHDDGTPYWFLYLYDGSGHMVPGETGNGYETASGALMAALAIVHNIAYPLFTPEAIQPGGREPALTQ